MKVISSTSIILAVAALLSLNLANPAYSEMKDMSKKDHRQEGHGQMMETGHMDKSRMGDMMGDMMGMCFEHADKIGLSDDQNKKIKPLKSDMQKRQVRFKADLKIAEIELMEIMEVKDFDLDKASSAINKISERISAHHLEMLKTMKEMRTVLTNEQFAKMKKTMSCGTHEKKPGKKIMK